MLASLKWRNRVRLLTMFPPVPLCSVFPASPFCKKLEDEEVEERESE